ncbi:MAG: o-succinylbenzoate synthase [Capnocytophaga sp.]|nr:o-succinylbenzoate synthase [Capnocytophaga sp.]
MVKKYILKFKVPAGTSRGVMMEKETYFLFVEKNGKIGVGECGILRGLSADDVPEYENKLHWVDKNLSLGKEKLLAELLEFPSIQFGVEQAFLSVEQEDPHILFPSLFTEGKKSIPINGLVWMGQASYMKEQMKEKIEKGFRCIKMKIGAIDFETELQLLKALRKEFSVKDIEIRVDANGAFSTDEVMEKLYRLSELQLHSIEQPIRAGQLPQMASLCATSPIPIALDEELIGVFRKDEKEKLLAEIRPQYIILKPSLTGGYQGNLEWISVAQKYGIGYWITSALESNIGLNAIAQWTFTLSPQMPQGLGTGSLYTNNMVSPLVVSQGELHYGAGKWGAIE